MVEFLQYLCFKMLSAIKIICLKCHIECVCSYYSAARVQIPSKTAFSIYYVEINCYQSRKAKSKRLDSRVVIYELKCAGSDLHKTHLFKQ